VILAAAAALVAGWLIVKHVSISTVAFPSLSGANVLRRTRVDVGDALHFETWYQPSSFSYRVGTQFAATDRAGNDLECRIGLDGWARPQALTGSLLDGVCECSQPRLHDRGLVPCRSLIAP
jgi:hypothetical protein